MLNNRLLVIVYFLIASHQKKKEKNAIPQNKIEKTYQREGLNFQFWVEGKGNEADFIRILGRGATYSKSSISSFQFLNREY